MDASHAHGAREHDRRRRALRRTGFAAAFRRPCPRNADPSPGCRALNEPAWCLRDRGSLLIEFPGRSLRIEDARERARLLAAVGTCVDVVWAGGRPRPVAPDAPELPGGWTWVSGGGWERALRSALAGRPGLALVCAGDPASRARARALAGPDRAVIDWPTTLTGDPHADALALDWSVAARATGVSSRSSLWDGEYVLVPGVPEDAAAAEWIDAFAQVAARRPSLELVFLGELPAGTLRRWRGTSIARRVHGAGEAPLRAECTWLAGASAVLLSEAHAHDPSLVLRTLAAGTPLVLGARGPRLANLAAWLERRGARSGGAAASGAAALDRVLAGGPALRMAAERGSSFAHGRDVRALAAAVRGARPAAARGREAA